MRPPPELRDSLTLADGTIVTIRPITPADAGIETEFVARLSPQTRRYRFLSGLKELTPEMLRRFLNVDFPHEMALVATIPFANGEREIGVARYAPGSQPGYVEFAVVVDDEWQGKGIGPALLERLFAIAELAGYVGIEGVVLTENYGMLKLMERMGFSRSHRPHDAGVVHVSKTFG
jgi:acetyltransferase